MFCSQMTVSKIPTVCLVVPAYRTITQPNKVTEQCCFSETVQSEVTSSKKMIFIFQRQNAVVSCTLLCAFHSVMHMKLVYRAPLCMDANQVRASYRTVDISACLFKILSSETISSNLRSLVLVSLGAFSGLSLIHI